MQKLNCKVTFNLPGFIGDAEQKSAWRTPPFKALLQNWWRVAVAAEHQYQHKQIRESEGRLFGHAWLKDNKGESWAMRSRFKIRLERSTPGQLSTWNMDDIKIKHAEVKFPVGAHLYLGYGPLEYKKGSKKPVLKKGRAIKDNETNHLSLIFPTSGQQQIQNTLQLAHWFGALGGRSRNGWGSVAFAHDSLQSYQTLLNGEAELSRFSRSLTDCLQLEWPHAIGTDNKGVLIWKTEAKISWMAVMRDLAEIKIGFRTALSVTKPFDERHILAMPITHHNPKGMNNERVSNQLRFKVIQHNKQFYGLVFHLPCKFPSDLDKKMIHPNARNLLDNQLGIWQKVHLYLDQNGKLKRTGSK